MEIFEIVFWLIFSVIATSIFLMIGYGIFSTYKETKLPLQEVKVKIIGKTIRRRNEFEHYYMTFEQKSGERFELEVKSEDYGLYIEGDEGYVIYQGTKMQTFIRQN